MKTQSNYLITAVVAVVVGAVAFFGGMQYQMRQRPTMNGQFTNRMGGPRGQGETGSTQGGPRAMIGMAPVSGEIISQDDSSITVKMPDGSSKIVILSDQTTVNKSSAGTKTDLKTGEEVTAFGTQNQDGSITAQSVSIGRGMIMMRGMGGQGPSSTPTAQ
jgi:hypothetical protein